jgi:predicted phage terminase large subunit-like protein
MNRIDPDLAMRLFEGALRSHFPTFLRKVFETLCPGQTFEGGWPIEAMAYEIDRIVSGEECRLIVNLPPRSLKSITFSVALPAFLLGLDPRRRIICVSYSGDLAKKLANDFRAVIESEWYRRIFPNTRIGSKNTEAEIEFTARGYRMAVSVHGTLTGRGGDLIIIDDPIKPEDALSEPLRTAVNNWFLTTLLSRLDNKVMGQILIVMQRLHVDDLTGFVLDGPETWKVLKLSAQAEGGEQVPLLRGRVHTRAPDEVLWPRREPHNVLDKYRGLLGSEIFAAQYLQEPMPPGGAMIKRAWICRYSTPPARKDYPRIFQSWDTASKGGPDNDWSVCTTWQLHEKQYYLLHVERRRFDYPELKKRAIALADQYRPMHIFIEDTGTGTALIQELKAAGRFARPIKPERDKLARMSAQSGKFEAGLVHLPEWAPWLPDFEAELFSFPNSKHDDQIDSVSQALQHAMSGVSMVDYL